jgi:hypothetical protein
VDRIVESPTALMTGGRSCYFDLDESRQGSIPPGGGPLDAADHLPAGGAWNYAAHDVQLSYFSVLRPGYLA